MMRTLIVVGVLALTCSSLAPGAAGQTPAPATPKAPAAPKPAAPQPPAADDSLVARPWTGDLEGMIKRRMIRVLVPYSKTHYFIDNGVQRGVTYDALKQFEDELNTKHKTGNLRVHVLFVPTSRDKLQAALLEGRGDIVAAN